MGFTVNLNGEKIHEMDVDPRLVTGVRMMTAQGEAGVAGSALNGVGSDSVSLIVDFQQSDTLPMLEDDARLAADETPEVTTYNENARREAALEEVDAEYAKKAEENPGEDYTDEYQAAREAAVSGSDTPSEPETPAEPDPEPEPESKKAKVSSSK